MNLFHLHKFEKIKSISCKVHVSIFGDHFKVDGELILEKCSKKNCNKLRAYVTEGTTRQDVDLNFVESKLGKEWMKIN